jgi:hypothetical protein
MLRWPAFLLSALLLAPAIPASASDRDLRIDAVRGEPRSGFITTPTSVWIQFDSQFYRWDSRGGTEPREVQTFTGPATPLKGSDSGDRFEGYEYWFDLSEGLYFARKKDDPGPSSTVGRIRQDTPGTWLLEEFRIDHLVRWDGVPGNEARPGMRLLFRGRVMTVGNSLWMMNFGRELYRMTRGTHSSPVRAKVKFDDSARLYTHGSELWIATDKGLLRWSDGEEQDPRRVDHDFGRVFSLHAGGEFLWVNASKGLFRWRLTPKGPIEKIAEVTENHRSITFQESRSALWIRHEDGYLRWDKTRATLAQIRLPAPAVPPPPPPDVPTGMDDEDGDYRIFQTKDGWLWARAHRCLVRWDDSPTATPSVVGPLPNERDINFIFDYRYDGLHYAEAGNSLWIGTYQGLFRCDPTGGTPPAWTGLDTGPIADLHFDGSSLWISGNKGLFRLGGFGGRRAKVEVTRPPVEPLYPNHYIGLGWKIPDTDWSTTPELAKTRVVVFKPDGQDMEIWPGRWDPVQKQYILETDDHRLPVGNYEYAIEVVNLLGQVHTSPRQRFRVQSGPVDEIKEWVSRLVWYVGLGYGVVNVLVFVGLVVATRWSGRSLGFLTSLWVLRLGVYYGWALRNLRPLQVWVLTRYYRSARPEAPTHPHVPRPLSRPQPPDVLSTDLLDELKRERRIWITGGPGTGKTDTVGAVLRAYFARTASAWSGWWQFGFIPVLVRLRDTAEASLERILMDALSRHGVSFGDERFARGFLRSAPLLFILDGVNEALLDHRQLEAWLPSFLQTAPRARILATSQTAEGSGNLPRYQMPPITGEFARELLRAFLGDAEGSAAYAAAPSELWDGSDQLTAYEVRQVADLARRGRRAPGNRTELYLATLEAATEGVADPEAVREALSRLAWDAWLEGRYRFSAPADLPEPLQPNLLGPILVRRGVGVDGREEYEFVHELMRAYLAARWAVVYATSPIARLDDEEVWRPGPARHHEAFFTFLAELIPDAEEMQAVAEFALEAPKLRADLLDGVRRVAQRKVLELHLLTVPERAEYVEALCHISEAELGQVITVLGLNAADFPSTPQRAQANAVFARCRRLRRLPELREQIRGFYLDAPLFEHSPVSG